MVVLCVGGMGVYLCVVPSLLVQDEQEQKFF